MRARAPPGSLLDCSRCSRSGLDWSCWSANITARSRPDAALHRIIGGWLSVDDYLGYTLADHAGRWRAASERDRPREQLRLQRALTDLGEELSHSDAQFRTDPRGGADLGPRGGPVLASWRPELGLASGDETTDRVAVTDDSRGPLIELTVRYRVVPEIAEAVTESKPPITACSWPCSACRATRCSAWATWSCTPGPSASGWPARRPGGDARPGRPDLPRAGQRRLRRRQREAEPGRATSTWSNGSSPRTPPPRRGRPPRRARPRPRRPVRSRACGANTPSAGSTPSSSSAAAPQSPATSAGRSPSARTTSP